MITINDKIKAIMESISISDPNLIPIMPDPNMDSGYYFVYRRLAYLV